MAGSPAARVLLFALGALASCVGRAPVPDAVSADGGASDAPAVFVALARDFEGFESWRRFDLGSTAVGGHPPGERTGFLYLPGRLEGGRFPVGTRIVKRIRVDGAADTFEYLGMVKRGGGFNAEGATDWEFFLLERTPAGVVILDRGTAPLADQSHLYAGVGAACNICHGRPTDAYDHVISPSMRPDALAALGL